MATCNDISCLEANTALAACVNFKPTLQNDRIQQSIFLWYLDENGDKQPVDLSVYSAFEMTVRPSWNAAPSMTVSTGGGGLHYPGANEIQIDAKVTADIGINYHDLVGRRAAGDRFLWRGEMPVSPTSTSTN